MSAILNPLPPSPKPAGPQPAAPPPVAEKPSRRWIWILAAVVVAAGGFALWQRQAQPSQAESVAAAPVKTAKVVNASLETRIRVSGQTSAREFVNVIVPRMVGPEANRPLVILKLAKSGVLIKKGDVLCEIDGQAMQDHIDDVHSTVVQAESDIKKRSAEQAIEWENLQQSVRLAKAELDKIRTDAKATEVRTVIDQELIKLSVEEAEAAYKELLAETQLKKISQTSELKILDYTRERHTRHRDRHKKDLARFVVTAQMDGLVVVQNMFRGGEFVALGEGDQVFPGQLVAKIVKPKSMQVEANINQAESERFRIGQEASVTLDAFPGSNLRGKIYSIGAIAVAGSRQNAYIRNIPVRIAVDEWEPRLIPDLSAGADVKVDRAEAAAVVPLGAIREEAGKALAYVKQGAEFVAREVKVGKRNQIEATVVSGLSAGDEVALNYEPPSVKGS